MRTAARVRIADVQIGSLRHAVALDPDRTAMHGIGDKIADGEMPVERHVRTDESEAASDAARAYRGPAGASAHRCSARVFLPGWVLSRTATDPVRPTRPSIEAHEKGRGWRDHRRRRDFSIKKLLQRPPAQAMGLFARAFDDRLELSLRTRGTGPKAGESVAACITCEKNLARRQVQIPHVAFDPGETGSLFENHRKRSRKA